MNLRHAKIRLALFAALLTPMCASAQTTPRLADGKLFTVTGKLAVKFVGWHSYLIVETEKTHRADFGKDEGTKIVHEVELNIGDQHDLAMHAGESVTATGKLQMVSTSPYYYNGVMLMIDKATVSDGVIVLRHVYKEPVLPMEIESYLVTVSMVPKRLEWVKTSLTLPAGKALAGRNLDGCSLQGSGELLNCFCTNGFTPVRAGVVPHAFDIHHLQQIPTAEEALEGMAQFSVVGEDDEPHPLTYQVVCKRKSSPAK